MNPNSLFCQTVASIISQQPGVTLRQIRARLPKASSTNVRHALRALVVSERIRPDTAPTGITAFFPKEVSFDEWLEQMKRMPPDTQFTLYFDFTLSRGWMRKNLEKLGWSVNLNTGEWIPPEGTRP